jgi:hypothetical protein
MKLTSQVKLLTAGMLLGMITLTVLALDREDGALLGQAGLMSLGAVICIAGFLGSSSAQIAQGNQDLSQPHRGTGEHAGGNGELDGTAHGSTVTQNADNARQASQLAHRRVRRGAQGRRSGGQVVTP